MKILHIIPRWIGGGPERGILEIASHDRALPGNITRRVVVLDKPISAPLFIKARRLGVSLVVAPQPEELEREIEDADIVEITYWNHPLLLDVLRRPFPLARLLIRSAIAGNTLPHILFPELVALPDFWILSAPPGHGKYPLAHGCVRHVPALSDMKRLANFAPRSHCGVRIAYLGSLEATKLHPGFAHIVAGVDRQGMHFDIFGDADAGTVAALTQALNARNALERVTFHGHVEQIADAFAKADIFAYPLAPGSYVTSEKALQEAMWAGLPSVLIEGTAATGWIEHGVTGFIAQDCQDFVLRLKQLANDPVLRRRIGDAAASEARRLFDPDRNAVMMAEIYAELAERPKRKRLALSGAKLPPSQRFLQSLGEFENSFFQLISNDKIKQPIDVVLNVEILLHGEGGLIHYANTFSDENLLIEWADSLRSHADSLIYPEKC
ncbi:glycosyltransferase family 4 protein [Hydrogenophaga taeniospiralis]|uniref:glycosyltransferase family 4 protein n=1 Tax=Hydrogenophaga taeniospiralis TaxID=65656 RepID=UPI001CFB4F85|nr:glycosyltransferase family 4 protein [Hydrogenophaga taeniospiralis]UCU92222.1 glycosyltransferase family 4 protein [Hydrogenophaga taeniospiralis]